MSIQTFARGTVVGTPVEVQTDQGLAAVFVLAPRASSSLGRELAGPWPAVCEVWCRDRHLAAAVMQQLHGHDAVVLAGHLWLEPVIGPLEDELSAARVHIEAESVGIDVAS